MKPYLLRGALAGVAGGVVAALVLVLLGESSIRAAIELEAASASGEAHAELFSRSTQVGGGVVGMVLYGLVLGVVFGVVYAAVQHRLGAGAAWRRARRLAVIAFVAVHLVPFLKYPANPPAVGDPETVDARSIGYLSMVALSVLAVVLAAVLADRLRRRGVGEPVVQPAAAATWLAVVAAGFLVLPDPAVVDTVPVELLWSFRVASIGGLAALWAVAGTVFGLLSLVRVLGTRLAGEPGDGLAPVGVDEPAAGSPPA
jgi:hypothetical protein